MRKEHESVRCFNFGFVCEGICLTLPFVLLCTNWKIFYGQLPRTASQFRIDAYYDCAPGVTHLCVPVHVCVAVDSDNNSHNSSAIRCVSNFEFCFDLPTRCASPSLTVLIASRSNRWLNDDDYDKQQHNRTRRVVIGVSVSAVSEFVFMVIFLCILFWVGSV